MRQTLSGIVENPYAIWTSAGATLGKTDGANWKKKAFPRLKHSDPLKDFRKGDARLYDRGNWAHIRRMGGGFFSGAGAEL